MCQKQGWGTTLMKSGLREVDRDNLPAFLGCPERLLPFFEKFNFEVIGEFEYDGIRIVCLFRDQQNIPPEELEEQPTRPRSLNEGVTPEKTTSALKKVYRDGLDDALLGDAPVPGLDAAVDQMLQGFFEKLSKITH